MLRVFLDRVTILLGLLKATDVMNKERQEFLDKEKAVRKIFGGAWDEQKKLRTLHQKIEKSFKD